VTSLDLPAADIARDGPVSAGMTGRERLAMSLIGVAAFLPLYAPQSVMPEMATMFGVSKAAAGSVIGVTTLSVALAAPIAGPLTDRFGHKRAMLAAILLLVPLTILLSLCTSLDQVLAVRFLQGLVLPALFSGAVAYAGERWRGPIAASATALYVSGSALGGFAGRFITGGLWDRIGWEGSFLVLAAISALCGLLVGAWLPKAPSRPPGSLLSHIRGMRQHLGNRRIRAACAIGAAALFSMTATLSYVGFRLAAPPFSFSAAETGLIFLIYPLSATSTSLTAPLLRRLGMRNAMRCALGLCLVGQAVLLAPHAIPVMLGLSLFVAGIFLVQSLALGFVGRMGGHAKGAAVGLYVCCFYVGGSLGSILPGFAWNGAGWTGCVLLVMAAIGAAALAAAALHDEPAPGTER